MNKYFKIILSFLIISLFDQYLLKADADDIIQAMKDEISRSINELYLQSLEKPYFIEYRYNYVDYYHVDASLGALIDTQFTSSSNLTVDLRVGDYKFDNTNFLDFGFSFFGSSDDEENFKKRKVSLYPDYYTFRRELWLATDAAYKQVSEIYSKKISVLKSRNINDTTPDFLNVKPMIVNELIPFPSFDYDYYKQLIKEISAIFKDYPEIQRSIVGLEYIPKKYIMVNSEGSVVRINNYYAGLEIIAMTQSDDGMPLMDYYTVFAKNPANLPSKDSLIRAAMQVAENLKSLRNAPKLKEDYSGPILFEDNAAAQLLAQVFAPNLVTQRMPMTERGLQESDQFTAFQTKIGGRVLPEFLSIKAIPNLDKYNSIELLGNYLYDDDGIKSQDVDLVKNGFLKTLLSSRVPTRRVKNSNGHNRGGSSMLSTIQLISEQNKKMTRKELINRMLNLCKDRELDYGIIVKSIPDKNILYTTFIRINGGKMSLSNSQNKTMLNRVYKVYPDGREELIRGCELNGLTVQSFKDILNVGDNDYVLNYLAPSITSPYISGGEAYVGTSIISPDLLFEDGEIKTMEVDFPKTPIISNPVSEYK